MSQRIKKIFQNKDKKLVTFVTGGDPNKKTSNQILETIVKNGTDLIEIGMPFSDPMADGPTIQISSNRAIKNGTNLDTIFDIVRNLRKNNDDTPIILMGYYNVILHYGLDNFVKNCKVIGIDGLIIVDLQPEEDIELLNKLNKNKIDLIRLITPNTTMERLKIITKNASGFLYYVTITGVTGQQSANMNKLKKTIKNIKKFTSLPIVAGFGINNKKQVKEICQYTDGVVVGSSIVKIIEKNLTNKKDMISLIDKFIKELKKGTFG
ncbi:tryptophan synthase subunit alpha [Alphaproteobacteria bacterium]|nr:tryptophan synthase subunit alpha [Alphaproteobacteria bacterium]